MPLKAKKLLKFAKETAGIHSMSNQQKKICSTDFQQILLDRIFVSDGVERVTAQLCLILGMCVTGLGIGRFVFNIGYMCYRTGDGQICV
jgi:hypothetical protein